MPGITGMGLTFNLPNFVGELFEVTPADTPFTSVIGGLTGGKAINATMWEWQEFDLRDASQDTKIEGAPAPDPQHRVRVPIHNVVQIHQESIDVSYTKQAAVGQLSGLNIEGSNPVRDELSFQTMAMLKQIGRDIEFSFLNGTYQQPITNAMPRKTRGILEAITTNVIDAKNNDLDAELVLDLMQKIWDNGGIRESETATIIASSYQKRMLTKAFITDRGFQEATRNVGGVNLQTIETDFGRLNIMLNRFMPKDQIAVVSMEMCQPVFLHIPGKGFLFVEPLGKIGASDKYQFYGEVGLEWGNERAHGKITGLATV